MREAGQERRHSAAEETQQSDRGRRQTIDATCSAEPWLSPRHRRRPQPRGANPPPPPSSTRRPAAAPRSRPPLLRRGRPGGRRACCLPPAVSPRRASTRGRGRRAGGGGCPTRAGGPAPSRAHSAGGDNRSTTRAQGIADCSRLERMKYKSIKYNMNAHSRSRHRRSRRGARRAGAARAARGASPQRTRRRGCPSGRPRRRPRRRRATRRRGRGRLGAPGTPTCGWGAGAQSGAERLAWVKAARGGQPGRGARELAFCSRGWRRGRGRR